MSPQALVLALWRTDRVARFSAVACLAAVALAAAVLVAVATVPAAMNNRAARLSWRGAPASPLFSLAGGTGGGARPGTAVLVADTRVRLLGHDLERVDISVSGSGPTLPGLNVLPRAGQTLVSPALADAMRNPSARSLRAAVPGRVIGTLGPAALAGPDEWVFAAGRPRSDLIGTDAVAGPGHVITAPFLIVLCWIALGVLVFPATALAAQVTRLQTSRRGSRLAALRLAGADVRWVLASAVMETTAVALAGSLLGTGLGIVSIRALAGVSIDGTTWWASTLTPPLWAVLGAVLLLPAVVAISTAMAVLPVAREPFTAVRATPRRAPGHWRVLLVPAVVVAGWLALSHMADSGDSGPLVAVMAAGVVTTTLVGSWTVHQLGRAFGRLWRGPALLLASRRMRGQSMGVWAVASGPVLAAFAAACVLAMLPVLNNADPVARKNEVAVALPARAVSHVATVLRERAPGASVSTYGGSDAANIAFGLDATFDPGEQLVVAKVHTAAQRAAATAALLNVAAGARVLGSGPRREQADVAPALGLGAAICLILSALLAAAATALSTVGGVLDRRRQLAALRLAGVPVGGLNHALRAEVTLPTTLGTLGAAAAGVLLARSVLAMAGEGFHTSAWSTIIIAVAIAALLPWLAAWLARPVLIRNTGLDAVRT